MKPEVITKATRICVAVALVVGIVHFHASAAGFSGLRIEDMDLDENPFIVTNVNFDGLATASDVTNIVDAISSNLTDIAALIPVQASPSNQLADKAFVNSSIATSTATFCGTSDATNQALFVEWLESIEAANENDYVFWQTKDGDGNTVFKRYKYVVNPNGLGEEALAGHWLFEYDLNNSSFTAVQWAAVNSGITSGAVSKLSTVAEGAQVNVIESVKTNGVALLIADKSVDIDLSSKVSTNDFDSAINALNTALAGKANDDAVVKLTGDQEIAGTKTFTSSAFFNFGLASPSTVAVYGQDAASRFEFDDTSTGNSLYIGKAQWGFSTDLGFSLKIGYDSSQYFFAALPFASGTIALESTVAAAATALTNYTDTAISNAISASNTTFSNAVLSVGLNIDTNTVAAINALVEQGEQLPVGGTTTVGALLVAIVAAIVALRRKLNYPFVAAEFSSGVLTIAPFANNQVDSTMLANISAVSSVAIRSANVQNVMRDLWLVVDCTQCTAEDLPNWNWGNSPDFIGMNGDNENLALEAGKECVFMLSEFTANRFMVARQLFDAQTA